MPTTTAIGRVAETLAASHLEQLGHRILDRNWRNRWCELDIITNHQGAVHFVEVKYRRNTAYGLPVEYINYDKITRQRRATAAWCQAHSYAGPYQIDIVSISGPLESPVIEILENAVGS